MHLIGLIISVEKRLLLNQFRDYASKGPDIHLFIILVHSENLLRGPIPPCRDVLCVLVFLDWTDEGKICNTDFVLVIDQYVLRLDVSVHKPLPVQVIESLGDLGDDRLEIGRGEIHFSILQLDVVVQEGLVHKRVFEVELLSEDKGSVEGNHVWVAELLDGLDFLHDFIPVFPGVFFFVDFHCHQLVDFFIDCSVDHAIGSFSHWLHVIVDFVD